MIETDRDSEKQDNEASIRRELESQKFFITKTIRQSMEFRFTSITDKMTESFLDKAIFGLEGRPINQKWLIAKYISENIY